MESTVIKRSIVIKGHKTSVSLEHEFWEGLKEIARTQGTTLSSCVSAIDDGRENGNLSSAIRLYVLAHIRAEHVSRHDQTSPSSIAPVQPSTS